MLRHQVEQVRALLRDLRSGPTFLFFHTYEVHDPYRARQPYFQRFSGRAGEVVSRQVRLIDLAPTLLELAGLPPPGDMDGRSLVPLIEGSDEEIRRELLALGYVQ